MTESIKAFENSLRDYLVDVQTDAYNTSNKLRHKYNNLKVYMDPQKNPMPHFYVSANISAACYSLEPLQKISGSMGYDERFILMWASRPNIHGELRNHWKYINSANELYSVQTTNETEDNLEISKEEIKEAQDTVTGSGVKKTKTKSKKGK